MKSLLILTAWMMAAHAKIIECTPDLTPLPSQP
jgi:hypothetical protein